MTNPVRSNPVHSNLVHSHLVHSHHHVAAALMIDRTISATVLWLILPRSVQCGIVANVRRLSSGGCCLGIVVGDCYGCESSPRCGGQRCRGKSMIWPGSSTHWSSLRGEGECAGLVLSGAVDSRIRCLTRECRGVARTIRF